jgi:fructose-1,6-bisphosphatase
MVAAGYTMYGSSCNLVLSTGHGVNGFTLDEVNFALWPFCCVCFCALIRAGWFWGSPSNNPGSRRVHPHPSEHPDPQPRQDLLIQRGQLQVLVSFFVWGTPTEVPRR